MEAEVLLRARQLQDANDELRTANEALVLEGAERSAAEAGRATVAARLQAIVDTVADGIITIGEQGVIESFNRAATRMYGYEPAEVLGRNVKVLMAEPWYSGRDQFVQVDRDTGRPLNQAAREGIGRRKDGTPFPVEATVSQMVFGGRSSFTFVVRDVTARRQAEETSRRMAWLVASSDDAIVGRTLEGIVTTWNSGAERMFGWSAVEMVGQPISRLVPARFREEEAARQEHQLESGQVDHYESVRLRKDGTEVSVAITVSPIKDEHGVTIGVSKIARDITRNLQAQQALLRAKEEAEDANRQLESFSYSVAHDLRAPLRSIDGFSQALLEDCGDQLGAEGKKYLGFVRQSAQLMGQLIDDLLHLSRVTRSELAREVVDLSALARGVLGRLEQAEPGRHVEVVIEEGLTAWGDPNLLTVALNNLLGNAWKFTARREAARVEFGAAVSGGQPTYYVRDNGAGFDMAYVGKLFGVFQRLHGAAEFEGTGVGLATVQRIIHRHHGRVWAEGQLDQGATFHFTLGEKEPTP
jgi:PAS domain S-box-containing protein